MFQRKTKKSNKREIPILIDQDASPEARQKKVGPLEGEAASPQAVAAQEVDQTQYAGINQGAETTTEIVVIGHHALTLTSGGKEGQDPLLEGDTTTEGEVSTRTKGYIGMKGNKGLGRLPEDGQDHHREDIRGLLPGGWITEIIRIEIEEDRQSKDEEIV